MASRLGGALPFGIASALATIVFFPRDVDPRRDESSNARAFYAKTAMAFKQGDRSSPYLNGLLFPQPTSAADPDTVHKM